VLDGQLAGHDGGPCAGAVVEIPDDLREHVWARYGLQIQQVLRDEHSQPVPAVGDIDIDIDEADVPF